MSSRWPFTTAIVGHVYALAHGDLWVLESRTVAGADRPHDGVIESCAITTRVRASYVSRAGECRVDWYDVGTVTHPPDSAWPRISMREEPRQHAAPALQPDPASTDGSALLAICEEPGEWCVRTLAEDLGRGATTIKHACARLIEDGRAKRVRATSRGAPWMLHPTEAGIRWFVEVQCAMARRSELQRAAS